MDNKELKKQRLLSTAGVQLSENTYNIAIGLTLLWGILINVGMAFFLTPYIVKLDIRVVLIGYFVVTLASFFAIARSSNPAVSFLGFTGLACAMGVLLTSFLTMYTTSTIYSAFLTTGIIVVSIMIVSTIFPQFFLSLGRVLIFALIGSLLVQFVGGLLFHLNLGIMDYVMVVIFGGYVGYDWAQAQMFPKTLDNAIDSAADIYVDIVNIFIHILSIMGNKND